MTEFGYEEIYGCSPEEFLLRIRIAEQKAKIEMIEERYVELVKRRNDFGEYEERLAIALREAKEKKTRHLESLQNRLKKIKGWT